jgi:hypothetical protein
MKAFIVALAVLALIPTAASAKEGIELSSLPDYLSAGEPWVTTISAIPGDPGLPATHGVTIQITNRASGRQLSFPAAPLGDGTYRVRAVFPTAGRWDYHVVGLGNYPQQNWAPVDIASAAGDPPSSSSGSFPWAWVAGGAAALLVVGTLGVKRYRSP